MRFKKRLSCDTKWVCSDACCSRRLANRVSNSECDRMIVLGTVCGVKFFLGWKCYVSSIRSAGKILRMKLSMKAVP